MPGTLISRSWLLAEDKRKRSEADNPARVRIDKLLVDLGLASSRERAQALVMAGKVLVDDKPVTKAGATVRACAPVRLKTADHPYVSRGGVKLAGAFEDLGVRVEEKTVLDIGASTGGFTDVCLRNGAARVYAVDVGTNQLDYRLRSDPRVTCLEKVNARHLKPENLPSLAHVAVVDVSFISLIKILPALSACLCAQAEIVALVKPQFEAGRDKVGKGGVVRDDAVRRETVKRVIDFAAGLGFETKGRAESRVVGPKGNRETFVHLMREGPSRISAPPGC